MKQDQLDLSLYSSSNRNFRLSRVFRDPSSTEIDGSNSKFELWIAFEFERGKLIGAQVIKTNGLNRPHSQTKTSSIDVQIAIGVAKEHEIHKSEREGVLIFLDHFAERSFEVQGSELFDLLEEQLEKIKPKNTPKNKADRRVSPKSSEQTGAEQGACIKRNGDGLLSEIDALLEQSYGFIETVRSTTLDEPTHR